MKTIVCEQPGQFVLREASKPVMEEGHAIVRIKRIGICGTDLHAYQGNQPFFTYPRILGHELSGLIEEIADNQKQFQTGDRVTLIPYRECGVCGACMNGKTNCCTNLRIIGVHMDGGMQEYVSIPVDHLIQTNDLSLEAAAVVECLSIGAHAVRRAGLKVRERVLVIGAGPIGLGVMKYAQLSGAHVTVMDVNQDRLEFCRSWADIDDILVGGEDSEFRLRERMNGELPDVVFDATGNKLSMESSFRFVANGGRLLFVGLVKASIAFDDPLFHQKELTLMSSRNATREDFETVIQSVRNGKVDIDSFITHICEFAQMPGTFEQWLDPANKVIKAMVVL